MSEQREPTTHTECLRTEVHIVCATLGDCTPEFSIEQYKASSYHELAIKLTPVHVARIFLTNGQVNRLFCLLDGYIAKGITPETIAADLAEPLLEGPDDRPTAQGNRELTE